MPQFTATMLDMKGQRWISTVAFFSVYLQLGWNCWVFYYVRICLDDSFWVNGQIKRTAVCVCVRMYYILVYMYGFIDAVRSIIDGKYRRGFPLANNKWSTWVCVYACLRILWQFKALEIAHNKYVTSITVILTNTDHTIYLALILSFRSLSSSIPLWFLTSHSNRI